MITFRLHDPTRAVYPIDGIEYDAIEVTFYSQGEVHGSATYCLRPGTALATSEDVRERAQFETDRMTTDFEALEAAGADSSTFVGVDVLKLSQLR